MLASQPKTGLSEPVPADVRADLSDFALSQSPTVFYVAGLDGGAGTTYVSPNVLAVTGHPSSAFAGNPDYRRNNIHPDDLPGYQAAVRALRPNVRATHEYRFKVGDGSYHWFRDDLVLKPGRDGGEDRLVGCMTDVTDRKCAEDSLRDMQALANTITEASLDAIVVVDEEDAIIEFNPVAEKTFGYSRAAVLGRPMSQLIIPEKNREEHLGHMRRFRETGEFPVSNRLIETEGMRADGTVFPVEVYLKSVQLGGRRAFVMELWDITERIDARREQQRLSQMLDDAIECIPNGIAIYDSDERLLRCNQAYATFFGETPESMVDSLAADNHRTALKNLASWDGADVDQSESAVEKSLARMRTADGRPIEQQLKDGRWAQITSHRTGDGGRVYVRTDITTVKQAEEQLRESEQQFRFIVEKCPTPLALVDVESGVVLYESPAAAALFGREWPAASSLRTTDTYVNPDDRQILLTKLRSEGRLDGHEVELKRIDGSRFWVAFYARVFERDGRPTQIVSLVDLTEIRHKEEALKQAHEVLEDAIESLVEGFALYDADDRLVTCNQRYREFNEVSADMLEPGVEWSDFIRVGADRGQYVDAIGRVDEWIADRAQRRHEQESDLEFQQSDGRWYRLSNQRTRQGGMVVTRTDITLNKAMETALRNSEALTRKVVEASPLPVGMTRFSDGLIIYASGSFTDLLGLDGSDGPPHFVKDYYVNPADRARYVKKMREDGAVDNYVVQLCRHDGETFWAALSGRLITYQGEEVIVSSTIDLTERRAVEQELARQKEALRVSEQRFRSLLDAYPIPVGMHRVRDGMVIYENPAGVALFGRRAVLGGVAQARGSFVNPEDRENYVARLRKYGAIANQEMHLRKYDGTAFWGLLSARMIEYDGEDVIVSSVFDLSERKAVEEQMNRQRDALYQTEKLSALGSLLAGVAHELNNPLSVVVGQALLLQETAEDPKIAKRAAKIGQAADRCSRIVRTFLAMARQQPTERAAVDLNDIIESTLEVTEYSLRTAGIETRLELMKQLPAVWADADQLNQVVTNLIVNAQQAIAGSAGGERLLTISTAGDLDRKSVLLTVQDTGPGIPAEIRSRIFEPFFTTKEVGAGTGIGLAVCHRIVEGLQGKISVRSQPGMGATFEISLPVAYAPESAEDQPSPRPREAQTGRILVIDDELEVSRMIADILRTDGHEVRTASSGTEALNALARYDFDVILSDLRMPNMDGPLLYEKLRSLSPRLLNIVAFITGDTFSPTVSDFLVESGRPYVQKPFLPEEVRELVAKVLVGGRGSARAR
ncbi:MAG: PAS domain S-box protein [Minwuiales bacterium]|nr:PAS domain S-box protein [Minwuiales bacterium]